MRPPFPMLRFPTKNDTTRPLCLFGLACILIATCISTNQPTQASAPSWTSPRMAPLYSLPPAFVHSPRMTSPSRPRPCIIIIICIHDSTTSIQHPMYTLCIHYSRPQTLKRDICTGTTYVLASTFHLFFRSSPTTFIPSPFVIRIHQHAIALHTKRNPALIPPSYSHTHTYMLPLPTTHYTTYNRQFKRIRKLYLFV